MNLNVPPEAGMGLAMPESKVLPSSLVTVCGAPVVFVQTTVVPALMVTAAGLNAKEPLLSVVIVTATVLPDGAVVGVLPPPLVAVGVVPPEAGGEPVLVPPHAARITMSASAASPNQNPLKGLKADSE